jgi:hypothetical protein
MTPLPHNRQEQTGACRLDGWRCRLPILKTTPGFSHFLHAMANQPQLSPNECR